MIWDSPLPLTRFSSPSTLTHSAFVSLLFPFKLGKWQPKWQISKDVTQASFAPDKLGNGKKICIHTREATKTQV